jgi:hypothetical protein
MISKVREISSAQETAGSLSGISVGEVYLSPRVVGSTKAPTAKSPASSTAPSSATGTCSFLTSPAFSRSIAPARPVQASASRPSGTSTTISQNPAPGCATPA